MAEKYIDPFEGDAAKALVDAATEINKASEQTDTHPENSRATMIHQRYIEGALNPEGNGEQ